MVTSKSTLSLPKVTHVDLKHMSLYDQRQSISLEVPEGVFCLAGANGLGKSTFLAAINYALTGVVAEPERKFESVQEFLKDNADYSKRFFDGRITEGDRKRASIAVTFQVGETEFKVERPFFENATLMSLSISRPGESPLIAQQPNISGSELHRSYTEALLAATGLKSFAQFAFLQQFVLTFDERRFLLFYNQRVIEQTMHIAFGKSPEDAALVDQLRRQAERADSNARNAKYQANELAKKIKQVQEALSKTKSTKDYERLMEEYEGLQDQKDAHDKLISETSVRLNDANIRLVELSSKQTSLEGAFRRYFDDHLRGRGNIMSNPVVRQSILRGACSLCGTEGQTVVDTIQAKVAGSSCPLCDSAIKPSLVDDHSKEDLQRIDSQLAQTKKQIEDTIALIERCNDELRDANSEQAKLLQRINAYETAHGEVLRDSFRRPGERAPGEEAIAALRSSMIQFETDAVEHRKRRDEFLTRMKGYQDALAQEYATVEEEFVPVFKNLAHQFLGVPLTVKLERGKQESMNLAVTIAGTPRRTPSQMSESQKFFVDIALRMALVQFASADTSKPTLLIDTPEGSLDIAYESRAGDMFATFAREGFHIAMTANINSSQLLKQLATRCGEKLMHIERMTDWRELSLVQKAGEGLFDSAYREITACLK